MSKHLLVWESKTNKVKQVCEVSPTARKLLKIKINLRKIMEEKESELSKKTQANLKGTKKTKKKSKKLSKTSKYFDFYDDIKAGCHKIVDW